MTILAGVAEVAVRRSGAMGLLLSDAATGFYSREPRQPRAPPVSSDEGRGREATPITMAAKSLPPDRGCVRQIGGAKAANPPLLLEEGVAVAGGDGGRRRRRRPSPPGSRAWGYGEGRGIGSRDLFARGRLGQEGWWKGGWPVLGAMRRSSAVGMGEAGGGVGMAERGRSGRGEIWEEVAAARS